MSIAVYSCITGGHETSKTEQNWGVADWYMFTDQVLPDNPSPDGWKYLPATALFNDPRRNARWHKLLSHQIFPEYDHTIWIDGSIILNITPEELVGKMGDVDIMTFRHPERKLPSEEAAECIRLKLDNPSVIENHIERIGDYPFTGDLAETKVVIRKNNLDVELFNQEWFYQLMSGTIRDQISFPYAAGMTDVKIKYMTPISRGNPDFSTKPHVRDPRYG